MKQFKKQKRVALSQRTIHIEEYGETRDCLDQRWVEFLSEVNAIGFPLPNNGQEAHRYLDALDPQLLILTGGNDSPEREAFEKSALEVALKKKLPVLGVCHGCQVLNTFCGGHLRDLSRDKHVARRHPIVFHKELFAYTAMSTHDMNSYHLQGMQRTDIAPEFEIVATHPEDGSVEAIYAKERKFYGIMWHPERENPISNFDLQMIHHLLEISDDHKS